MDHHRQSLSTTLIVVSLFLGFSYQTAADDKVPEWIWFGESTASRVYLLTELELGDMVKKSRVVATADNGFELFINGMSTLRGNNWNRLETADVTKHLDKGANLIAVEVTNGGGPGGFILKIESELIDGSTVTLLTSESWRASSSKAEGWNKPGFDDSSWGKASSLGVAGSDGLPWNGPVNPNELKSILASNESGTFKTQVASEVSAPNGFVVEKIYQVPRPMGSWVSLTACPDGRLIASDQGGKGLYFITPGNVGHDTVVEKVPIDLSGAQGLLWAFDSLYVVVNGGAKSGLHRIQDSDGDGTLDRAEHLLFIAGGGEHGPHGVVLSPSGQSLFVSCGNHTNLPNEIAASRIPQNWDEDLLLPRRWDANGHAAGKLAPGGWIAEVSLEGKQLTIHSTGYRNQYDIAFNADGELFTYDADMEWDMGSPWYRPTRVCHATSGSEFGWRSGTGKWPTYYEDSLPPVIDIGPGSPTGIVFGYGAKFPAKYQKALFVLDWTYSTIHAVHLEAYGSTYRGVHQDFVTGAPLSVTDATVGLDGSFYFAVGGRGTRSALYRVRYDGDEDTTVTDAQNQQGQDLRTLRHKLESMHGVGAIDLDFVKSNLGHDDRFIRYAARVALENAPIDSWRSELTRAADARTTIALAIATARQGTQSDIGTTVETLLTLDPGRITSQELLSLIRAYGLVFTRLGAPSSKHRLDILHVLDHHFPAQTNDLNRELVQLLVYLESTTVVAKTVQLMRDLPQEQVPDWGELIQRNSGYGGTVARMLENMPPVQGIHYAFTLRNASEGWTIVDRRTYLEFFKTAASHPGGASFPGFLSQMREDAISLIPTSELVAVDDVASVSLNSAPAKITPPKGPGREWTTALAKEVLGEKLKKRNYDQGRNLFHAAACTQCHRYNAEGGAIGPDLSTAGKKFSLEDLLDAILDPSKAISDQYGSKQIATTNGQTLVGRVVEIGNQFHVYTAQVNSKPIILMKSEIEEMIDSPVSQMPNDLLKEFNEEELKDLIAYILSAGNKRAAVYRD